MTPPSTLECGCSTGFGDGPSVNGVVAQLFCAWLAWSRFRAVLALLDKTLPSAMAAIDAALRIFGGAPYLLPERQQKRR